MSGVNIIEQIVIYTGQKIPDRHLAFCMIVRDIFDMVAINAAANP